MAKRSPFDGISFTSGARQSRGAKQEAPPPPVGGALQGLLRAYAGPILAAIAEEGRAAAQDYLGARLQERVEALRQRVQQGAPIPQKTMPDRFLNIKDADFTIVTEEES